MVVVAEAFRTKLAEGVPRVTVGAVLSTFTVLEGDEAMLWLPLASTAALDPMLI